MNTERARSSIIKSIKHYWLDRPSPLGRSFYFKPYGTPFSGIAHRRVPDRHPPSDRNGNDVARATSKGTKESKNMQSPHNDRRTIAADVASRDCGADLDVERSAVRTGKIWIGTSGWTYDGWRGSFYPQDIPKRLWLSHYATRFCTTEINGSFYRTPSLEAVWAWRDSTPVNFAFSWKASKFITHWKRLSLKCENSIALMETRLEALAPKDCIVLFQLPPNFLKDQVRLDSFIQLLPTRRRYAFEFRHPSWYQDGIMRTLQNHNVALCFSDHKDAPSPWETTAKHVYVRGHGPGGQYKGRYHGKTLARWAAAIDRWSRDRREVFVYFDNDQKTAAPKDALRLMKLMNG